MDWILQLELTTPDNSLNDRDLLDRFVVLLRESSSCVLADGNGWEAQITVDPENTRNALTKGLAVDICAAITFGLPIWPIMRLVIDETELHAVSLRLKSGKQSHARHRLTEY